MDRVTLSSKLIVLIVVLCSLNFYLAKCDYLSRNFKQFGPVSFSEKNRDYDVLDSSELESNEMTEKEYVNKMRLLEYILNEMNQKPELYKPVFKRGFARSLGKDDRRRPGWELAYGKRKRSNN
ncbi:hypothetical protein BpHYR1_033566 [Brachionus plicatilis]|uniref:Uncharacterized protein n=1 Tax=Brachionus plicatilis TaxID=10195 RepID=A0A3M7RY57_BRAPC|nr:hypothetical protein BpHYR1_033566 [Brachionus plicatilis]